MLAKTDADEIQSFLSDASNLAGGHAARVVFPETAEEVAEALAEASRGRVPVTVAGAGTGVVGGRIPFGGVVLATDRLKRIREIVRDDEDETARHVPSPDDGGPGLGGENSARVGRATAEAGVLLAEFQRAVEARGLFYPPDPTERSCYLGATVATNSSGARTFKYGPTRAYVRRLKVALSDGDLLDLRRGDARADARGVLRVPTLGGRVVEARLPSYDMPRTRKHAAGYFVRPGVDAVDLFVGSEGTLGVITEVEVSLLTRPEGVLSGLVFFDDETRLLDFVGEARRLSLDTRAREIPDGRGSAAAADPPGVDARALEYFDANSLNFLREHYPLVPLRAAGAIFFEQETRARTEDDLMAAWLALLERHAALLDDSWFGTNEHDRAEMREFRHKLPVLVNEWLARHRQRKVSTDMAVPDEHFADMLRFYRETLRARRLHYVVFGHIGDGHVHVNVMPRDGAEAAAARDVYAEFVRRAVALGGTISAEHGVGKIKREYLRELYGDAHLREMAALKRAFDPSCVLGRGNIFAEEFLR